MSKKGALIKERSIYTKLFGKL
ncbi:hypothetical protein T190115A13A_50229 [Tenacibaculum sp. 190524A02b]|uniref:Uncharacterized protein n=1 Tax=Tenacibaculum vairaonense TaxID=3137860 RepID=A0ABM9PQD2_9FLAO